MITIYHNPRCRKSREGLEILENQGVDFTIYNYIKEPLTYLEILELIKKLGIEPIELVRKNEPIWKENYKGKNLSQEDIVRAMEEHPKLIERPIVVKDDQAVVGRPPSIIKELIS